MAETESARVASVILAAREHLDYARTLLHDLVNSVDQNTLAVTAIAAEQAVEMDIRHAGRDLTTLGFYLPKDGGAVA
jgi:hypothetical protein